MFGFNQTKDLGLTALALWCYRPYVSRPAARTIGGAGGEPMELKIGKYQTEHVEEPKARIQDWGPRSSLHLWSSPNELACQRCQDDS